MDKDAYYQLLMRRMNNEKLFSGKNGITVTKIEVDRAEGEMMITEDHKNPLGGVHGGALCTLADSVASLAVCSRGVIPVTLNNTMNYLRQANEGKLTCTSIVTKNGRNIAVCETSIKDDTDRLIATGTFTFYIVDENLREKGAVNE